jgi:hypothetical protein
MSEATVEATHAYIGRMPCGCAPALEVDAEDHRDQVARSLARWAKNGWTVERVEIATVRAGGVISQCVHLPGRRQGKERQAALL